MSTLTAQRPAKKPSEIGHVNTGKGHTDALVQVILRYKAQNGDHWDVDVPITELTELVFDLLEGSTYLAWLLEKDSQGASMAEVLLLALFDMNAWGYITVDRGITTLTTTKAFETLCGA